MRNARPPDKKRKIKTITEEKIEFDPAAREEYLTGFHKRKVARRKFAEDEIAKKDKEEKLRFRRAVRIPSLCTKSAFGNVDQQRRTRHNDASTSRSAPLSRPAVLYTEIEDPC